MLATITDDCDNVLVFLQDVAVKSPQVIRTLLSLHADKCTHDWFRRLTDTNLLKPSKPAPKDHIDFMGVLTDKATKFHTSEALFPVIATQHKAENETKVGDCLPPTSQRVILTASATNGTSIPTSPLPTIHSPFMQTSARTTGSVV